MNIILDTTNLSKLNKSLIRSLLEDNRFIYVNSHDQFHYYSMKFPFSKDFNIEEIIKNIESWPVDFKQSCDFNVIKNGNSKTYSCKLWSIKSNDNKNVTTLRANKHKYVTEERFVELFNENFDRKFNELGLVTKNDLNEFGKQFATKKDLEKLSKNFVTKKDLEEFGKQFATKEDLRKLEQRVERLEIRMEALEKRVEALEKKVDYILVVLEKICKHIGLVI